MFARLQQFAGRVYGPIVARGIASWQGNDGNYWGHNAIIRVRAFAAAAGLPLLPGKKPFGGAILSHDFVEAALLRRAGWSVRMLPTLGGVWEDSPPSLLDVAARDRRWAQGNIQHLAVIWSQGFTWSNRVHMGIGVMSYLASPLWFALIVVGLGTAGQIATVQFEYFTRRNIVVPALAVVRQRAHDPPVHHRDGDAADAEDSRRAARLHRLGAPAYASIRCEWCSAPSREMVISALYAPIMMMMQVRQVSEILIGQDSGWATQSRRHARTPWGTLFRRHWLQTLSGIVVSAVLVYVSMPLFVWMAPALVGLVFALPLSAASGSIVIAKVSRFLGFLTVPEEVNVPRVIALRDEAEARLEELLDGVTIERLLSDEVARQRHFAAVQPRPAATRGHPDVMFITARAKLSDAHTAAEGLSWLSPPERLAVLGDRDLFHVLVRLVNPDVPDRPALRSA